MAQQLGVALRRAWYRVELVDGRFGPSFRVVRAKDGAVLVMVATRVEAERWIARYGARYRD